VLIARAKILVVILLAILQDVKLAIMEHVDLLAILQNVKLAIMEHVDLLAILQNVKNAKMVAVLLNVAQVKLVTMELVKIPILAKTERLQFNVARAQMVLLIVVLVPDIILAWMVFVLLVVKDVGI